MSVSWRHMLAGAGIAVLAASATSALGEPQCRTCAPPSPPPPAPVSSCCRGPASLVVHVPGVSVAAASVRVGASTSVIAAASVSTTLSSGVVTSGGASGGAIAFGGGGGFYSNPGVGRSSISGLVLEGGYETRMVEEEVATTENYCIDRAVEELQVRPVQAVCIDDKHTPHPASRVEDGVEVASNFTGEVFRCIAGTHMQVTLGRLENGAASFASGETFSCAKGEALWRARGGQLSCRPQAPERNCNERSLLRKFGPGAKLIEVAARRTLCEPATRTKVAKVAKEIKVPRALAAGDLQLDGGVGQGY